MDRNLYELHSYEVICFEWSYIFRILVVYFFTKILCFLIKTIIHEFIWKYCFNVEYKKIQYMRYTDFLNFQISARVFTTSINDKRNTCTEFRPCYIEKFEENFDVSSIMISGFSRRFERDGNSSFKSTQRTNSFKETQEKFIKRAR